MARPSKLTDAQWEIIGKRLLAGESAASLAREFKVSKASVSVRFSKRIETVKEVAKQIVETDRAISFLNVSERVEAFSLADDLKAMSSHLASAGKFGSMIANRCKSIAYTEALKIDEVDPMATPERMKSVKAMLELANTASTLPVNLLTANKEYVQKLNAGEGQSNEELLKELASLLPN